MQGARLTSKRNNSFLCAALAFSASYFMSEVAHSEPADLSRMSCAQFDDMRPADKAQFGLWLYGYYAGSAQKPQIDRMVFDNAMRMLGETCTKQKNALLIGAEVRAIFLPQQSNSNNNNTGGLPSSGATIPINPQQRSGDALTTGSLPLTSATQNNAGINANTQSSKPAPR